MGFGRKVGAFLGLVPDDIRDGVHGDHYDDFDGPDYSGEYGPDYGSDREGGNARYAASDYRGEREYARSSTRAGYETDTAEYESVGAYGARGSDGDRHSRSVDRSAHSTSYVAEQSPRLSDRGPAVTARSGGHSFATEPVTQGALAMQPRAESRREPDSTAASRPVTIKLADFGDARVIGEKYRDGQAVIMDMTEMADADARRLVDFAAGLAFAKRGSIDKVTTKVFMLLPPDVDVSAEDRREYAGAYNRR